MTKYQLRDIVTVREWDDMFEEFGQHPDVPSAINVSGTFMQGMAFSCGRQFEIRSVISGINEAIEKYKIAPIGTGDLISYIYTSGMFKETSRNIRLDGIAKALDQTKNTTEEIPE